MCAGTTFPPSLLSTAASTCTPPGATAATLTAAPDGPGPPPKPGAFFHAALLFPASITFHRFSESSLQIPPPQRAQRYGRSPRASPARITPHVPPSPKNSAAFALGTLRPARVDRITYRDETGNPLASPARPRSLVQTATSAAQSPDAPSATHRRRAPRPH
jgi:hypothetical protein